MSIKVDKRGNVVVRSVLTLYPSRDQALIDILTEAERTGSSLAPVIVELMRTGLPGTTPFEAEEDDTEMVDLSQLAMFDDEEE